MQYFSCIIFHVLKVMYFRYDKACMEANQSGWTFFSNHGHVYFLIALYPGISLREIADRVGITERTAIAIVQDLVNSEFIIKEKIGRSNQYEVIPNKTLRHPLESRVALKELVNLMKKKR